MKVGFALLALLVVIVSVQAQTAGDAGADFVPKNGEEVLINLQGENHDFWVINFYQPGDNKDEVKTQIKDAVKKAYPEEKFRYGEVNLSSGYEFQKLFETLDLVGEPKRGRTTPQVLVMKDGEGYIVHGPTIADAVVKRFTEVKEGKVFKSAPAKR